MSLSIFSSAFISSFDQMAASVASSAKTYMISCSKNPAITVNSGNNIEIDMGDLTTGGGIIRPGIACHATKLWIYCSATAGGTAKLYKNGAASGITVTLTSGANVYSATGSVALAATDALSLRVDASGGSNTVFSSAGVILEAD